MSQLRTSGQLRSYSPEDVSAYERKAVAKREYAQQRFDRYAARDAAEDQFRSDVLLRLEQITNALYAVAAAQAAAVVRNK